MTHYQGPPHIVASLDSFIKLMRAAESVAARVHQQLPAHNLTISQFGVLEALYHLGPMCQQQLALKILKSSGNMTMVINNLEKRNLVVRIRDVQDRRSFIIRLTPEGEQLIATIFPDQAQKIAEAFAVLDPDEKQELARLCKKLKPPNQTENPSRQTVPAMFEIINADNRHFNDFGWLQTYWLFSFGNYFDTANLSHGALRVVNDDIVQPHQGFPLHPHEEMEIISLVLSGTMRHEDTMGNETVIRPGDVQRMTAGTGLFHSEWNDSDQPVHFLQIWVQPDRPRCAPSYDQKNFAPESWHNRLTLLASNKPEPGVVALNTDASLYRATLTENRSCTYATSKDRRLFLYVIEGQALVNGRTLHAGDQARIKDEQQLTLSGAERADLILIDVP